MAVPEVELQLRQVLGGRVGPVRAPQRVKQRLVEKQCFDLDKKNLVLEPQTIEIVVLTQREPPK